MLLNKVICLLISHIFLVQCNVRANQHPTVHLHAGTIQTGRTTPSRQAGAEPSAATSTVAHMPGSPGQNNRVSVLARCQATRHTAFVGSPCPPPTGKPCCPHLQDHSAARSYGTRVPHKEPAVGGVARCSAIYSDAPARPQPC